MQPGALPNSEVEQPVEQAVEQAGGEYNDDYNDTDMQLRDEMANNQDDQQENANPGNLDHEQEGLGREPDNRIP